MRERLKRIFEHIPKTSSFADIGCDHGYIAKMMVESGKCQNITVSDISEKSLKKAEILLENYIADGKVKAVCCDGLEKINSSTQTVLIAGMGGEEVIKIIEKSLFLPPVLLVQPMKNADKVRKFLFDKGYGIVKDFMFKDVKFYNFIVAKLNEKVDCYSEKEFLFGRDNLKERGKDFIEYINKEIAILERYQKNMKSLKDIENNKNHLAILKEVLNEN